MAAGFNRQDPGRGMQDRRNISPWIQGSSNTNQYIQPAYENQRQRQIPHAPPPPLLRQNETSHSVRNTNFTEDISRNPYDGHSNSYYHDVRREHRSNGNIKASGTDRHFEQDYNKQNEIDRDSRKNYTHYQKESYRRSEDKKQNRPHYRSSPPRNRYPKDKDRNYKDDSEVECISLATNSPSAAPLDVSMGSPDITEVPRSLDYNVHRNPSVAGVFPIPGISQLEKAYNNRRMSQNSDSSEISFIPNSNSTLITSDQFQVHKNLPNLYSESYNTPASPDRIEVELEKYSKQEPIPEKKLCNDYIPNCPSLPKDVIERTSVTPPLAQPTIIPLYPEPNPIVGGERNLHICRLCNSGRHSFKSDYDFDMHLTKIHFEERLMKRIKPPYKCQKCFYSPPECLTIQEKEEDLLIHYGCNERLAIQYYNDECAKSTPVENVAAQETTASIACEMCSSSHDNERLFVRHITLRHFTKQLSDELPKKAPFICPFVDCNQEKANGHLLIMHYGVEHSISMELYGQYKTGKNERDPRVSDSKENADRRKGEDRTVQKYSMQNTNERNLAPLPSLPSILHFPPVQKGNANASQAISKSQKDASRSLNTYIPPGATMVKPSLSAITSNTTDVNYISRSGQISSNVEVIKEKKQMIIKRKKVSVNNALIDDNTSKYVSNEKQSCTNVTGSKRNHTIEHLGKPIKRTKIDERSSTSNNSGLQQIDIFAPDLSCNTAKSGSTNSKSTQENISCSICDCTFVTKKAMKYHLIDKHLLSSTIRKIKSNSPYNCTKCKKKFEPPDTAQQFTKHFYQSHLEDQLKENDHFSEKPECNLRTKSKAPKKDQESIETSTAKHRSSQATPSTDVSKILKSGSNDDECPSDSSSADSEVLPPSRIRKTIHRSLKTNNSFQNNISKQHNTSVSSARQRMRDNWQKTSIDSQNYEVESLSKRIKEMEAHYEEEIRLKAEEFERWITQKENSMETEKNTRKGVEQRLEQAQVDIVGLEKQLEQQQQSYNRLEEMLVEKHTVNHQLTNEKKDVERSLANSKEELEDSNKNLATKEDEFKEVHKKLDDQSDQVSDLESTIGEKDDELKELNKSKEWLKNDYEKQLARVQKQLDSNKDKVTKLNEEKKNKTKEIKEATLSLKERDEKIIKLCKENGKLALEIATQKLPIDESAEILEPCKSFNTLASSDGKQLNKNCQKCGEQDKQNKSLLDSLDRLQKIMEGHITVIEDKNKTIAELNSKCEDSENNLDQALQTLHELKNAVKQKKDSQKQIKQLQTTLRDWENRQYTNVKLISGLEKKNTELEKKIKFFEENDTGSEDLLYTYTTKIKKIEKETKTWKEKCDKSDKELAETNSRLKSRDEEVASLKSKIVTFETKVLELERAVRKGATLPEKEVQQLALQVENKAGEIKHLRKHLDTLKIQFARENEHHENDLAKAKETSDQFEMDYSKSLQKVEEFKKILSDAEQSILNQDSQICCYKDALNEQTVSKLKKWLEQSKTEHQLEGAAKVIDDLSEAVRKVTSGTCYNINEQSYLVKSEPVDDADESINSNNRIIINPVSVHDVYIKSNSSSPLKQISPVNTEKQIILNVPNMCDVATSDNVSSKVFQNSSPNLLEQEGITKVKQEPGIVSSSVTTCFSSQAGSLAPIFTKQSQFDSSTQISNQSQPNTFVVSRITNPHVLPYRGINQQTSSAAEAIQAIRHPIPKQGLFQNTPKQQQSQGFVESTFPIHRTVPVISSKDDCSESEEEESDTCLDDFFPQTDPLSGLTFSPKCHSNVTNIIQTKKGSTPKPSTSINIVKRSPPTKLEDVTGKYAADEEESYACGICNQFDPPLQTEMGNNKSATRYTTEWVGCDCERWFHKPCTKMKKFMKSFSCKSVKMKCLNAK